MDDEIIKLLGACKLGSFFLGGMLCVQIYMFLSTKLQKIIGQSTYYHGQKCTCISLDSVWVEVVGEW